ncbi:MAG: VanZ family protein [Clostridium sp.]|nr:VanZ family protein [Clostridium sp.]
MSYLEILLWYVSSIFEYAYQMLPCMGGALLLFAALRLPRKRRLAEKGLVSGPWREGGLLLFVMFMTGLASLTLFPADLWAYVMDRLLYPEGWFFRWGNRSLGSFYPSLEQAIGNTDYRNLFTPFQEIRRAIRTGGTWLIFMVLGNIGIFLPVGFSVALLWRKPRWWKSGAAGIFCSLLIESVQFFIGRSTDIDDVILNTTGALLGYGIFLLFQTAFPRFLSRFYCHEQGGDT